MNFKEKLVNYKRKLIMLTYNDLINLSVNDIIFMVDDNALVQPLKCIEVFKCEHDATCLLYNENTKQSHCITLWWGTRIEGDPNYFLDIEDAVSLSEKIASDRFQYQQSIFENIMSTRDFLINTFSKRKELELCKCGRNDATAPHPCPY